MSEPVTHRNENKRIARNTLFLYLRMLFAIGVNLYSVRIVWQALGVDNYGIYNVVAGIIVMFQFVNTAMVGASQRFLAFAIGKKIKEDIAETFSTSVKVHTMLAVLMLLIGETIGLWIFETQINLPPGRHFAGMWVYQVSIISMVVMVLSVPYNAGIVAYEDMDIYGIYGIVEVVLKLGVALALLVVPFDRLITYSTLLLVISILMAGLYRWYAKRHYPDLIYRKPTDNSITKRMFSFAGWTMLGSFGVSAREQGLNIILNSFFNVALNAAKGIANQVSGVVMGFTGNFQMSMFPQITKRYATGEIESMLRLVFTGGQLSYFLLLVISYPLMLRADYVLTLWLSEGVSVYMVTFLKITLISLLVDSLKGPLIAALQATGDVKAFQIWVFGILISALPMAWIWLKSDLNPYAVVYVTLITNALALVMRFLLLKKQIGLHGQGREVINMSLRIIACSVILWYILAYINTLFCQDFVGLVLFCCCSLAISLALIYFAGLTSNGRNVINEMVINHLISKLKGR